MNSKTDSPKQMIEKLTERNLLQDEIMAKMGAQINQLQRLVWMLVQLNGGRAEVNESMLPPLWQLKKERGPNNGLILSSTVLPEPPQEKMAALVDRLMNTDLDLIAVQKELELEEYPANFLAFHMSDKIILTNGRWLPNTIARAARGPEGVN